MEIQYEYKSSSSAYIKTVFAAIVRLILAAIIGFGIAVLFHDIHYLYYTLILYTLLVIVMFIDTSAKKIILNSDGVWIKEGIYPWNNQYKGMKWSAIQNATIENKSLEKYIVINQKEGIPLKTNNIKNIEEVVEKINSKVK